MTEQPFVSEIRARASTIRLGAERPDAITIRVEMPEVWDTVRIVAPPREPALTVKMRALEALYPDATHHGDFVLKFRGWEVLDEASPLADLGIGNGAILLVTHRRRRAVR